MARLNCVVCGTDLVNGTAVIRSVMFEKVAWCRPCWHAFESSTTEPSTTEAAAGSAS